MHLHTFLAALTDEIDFEIYLKCCLFVCLFFKAAHPSSCTPVVIKTPGVWFSLWSSGGHRAFCTSLCVYLLQCHCNSVIHPSDALVACSCVWLPAWSLVYMHLLEKAAGDQILNINNQQTALTSHFGLIRKLMMSLKSPVFSGFVQQGLQIRSLCSSRPALNRCVQHRC